MCFQHRFETFQRQFRSSNVLGQWVLNDRSRDTEASGPKATSPGSRHSQVTSNSRSQVSFFSSPYISPLPSPLFYRPIPNHPHSYAPCRCPNHLSLPCLATSATLCTVHTQKTVQIHTALTILQRHPAHPSHHHPFCCVMCMFFKDFECSRPPEVVIIFTLNFLLTVCPIEQIGGCP